MSAPLPRIDELGMLPEIGRRYLVPMIRHRWFFAREAWWPLWGPLHEDAEWIGFAPLHYHVDARFLTARQWRLLSPVSDLMRARCAAAAPISVHRELAPPEWRPATCRRLTSGFAQPDFRARLLGFAKLEAAFAADRLRRDANGLWVCPHKGAPLGSCPIEPDGTIICPLHGLVWHADSGLPAWAGTQ